MCYQSIESIKSLIEQNAAKHHAVGNDYDDLWEAEIIEKETMTALFRYMLHVGCTIDGYDLEKLLDAEDDDDEGVPPEGVDATLFDIIERIRVPEHSRHIRVPAEIQQLWNQFFKTFWPHY